MTQHKAHRLPTHSTFKTASVGSRILLKARTLAAIAVALLAVPAAAFATPTIHLEDARGNTVTTELVIGRSLIVHLNGATLGDVYRYTLSNAVGTLVEQVTITATGSAAGDATVLFRKSRIGGKGCQPTPIPATGSPGSPPYGPFDNLQDASLVIDGLVLFLTVEEQIVDPGTGSITWGWVFSSSFELAEPATSEYFFSDALGAEQCQFGNSEQVYLSVYNGNLDSFLQSRVYLLTPPDQDNWGPDIQTDFDDVRTLDGCVPDLLNDCKVGEDGTPTDIPMITTVPLPGDLPFHGQFVALIRDKQGFKQSIRYSCDRVTDGLLKIGDGGPQQQQSNEGWGCPPCPPS